MTSEAAVYALAHAAQTRARKRARARARRAAAGLRAGTTGTADITDTTGRDPPRRSPTQHAGDRAERRALAHLLAAGLRPVVRNAACRSGEIDLIMWDGPVLVFVEVRARGDSRYGGAAASVVAAKQRRLTNAARHFLHARWRGPVPPCRFDVIAFESDGSARWIRHAFAAWPAACP